MQTRSWRSQLATLYVAYSEDVPSLTVSLLYSNRDGHYPPQINNIFSPFTDDLKFPLIMCCSDSGGLKSFGDCQSTLPYYPEAFLDPSTEAVGAVKAYLLIFLVFLNMFFIEVLLYHFPIPLSSLQLLHIVSSCGFLSWSLLYHVTGPPNRTTEPASTAKHTGVCWLQVSTDLNTTHCHSR